MLGSQVSGQNGAWGGSEELPACARVPVGAVECSVGAWPVPQAVGVMLLPSRSPELRTSALPLPSDMLSMLGALRVHLSRGPA